MADQIYIPREGERERFFQYVLQENSIHSAYVDELDVQKSFARELVDRVSVEDEGVEEIAVHPSEDQVTVDVLGPGKERRTLARLNKKGFYTMLRVGRDYHMFQPPNYDIPEPVLAWVDEYIASRTGADSLTSSPEYFLWLRFDDYIELPERFFGKERIGAQKKKIEVMARGVRILDKPVFEAGEAFDIMEPEKYCKRIKQLLSE